MNIKHLNVGIMHSLIGKNDGVSIVIDQTVNAMVKDMGMQLGSIYFLAAHTSPRFNAETDEIFWHKNSIQQKIINNFTNPTPPEDLEDEINCYALEAKERIKRFVEENQIDLLIAHNTSHAFNFITAVGLGYYFEELRTQKMIWPKLMVWWHDSYFERDNFLNPNPVIDKFLRYLPGTDYVDAIAFINKGQPEIAKRYFEKYSSNDIKHFFEERAVVIPNTSDIPWNWQQQEWHNGDIVAPPKDKYNESLFKDTGMEAELDEMGYTLEDTVILLQHTRVVPRKKIEVAIDLAFKLEKKFNRNGQKKCITLLISGHSGDEQFHYKNTLKEYFHKKMQENRGADVMMIFGEHCILSHRDIIVDKKYYKFAEIPALIAQHGGIGTYFSEVEGYGNNLLEMICNGLPVVINKYDVYKSDIEELGFELPAIEHCQLTDELVEQSYKILTDQVERNRIVKHNLHVLYEKLDHRIISEILTPLIEKMFMQSL